jgi:hypothetical protein
MSYRFVDSFRAGPYQYRNTREKLYKTSAAMWYNKICREKQLTPNYISIKIKLTMPENNKKISILVLLESCLQTCVTYLYTSAECTVNKLLMMGRGTARNM